MFRTQVSLSLSPEVIYRLFKRADKVLRDLSIGRSGNLGLEKYNKKPKVTKLVVGQLDLNSCRVTVISPPGDEIV